MIPDLIIQEATKNDAKVLLQIQRGAFASEIEIYHDEELPPLKQTLDELISDFSDYTFLKATINGTIVGSVKGKEHNKICWIARLMVAPKYQGNGIGTKLMHAIEDHFPDAVKYELYTGERSERDIRLYTKLGYNIIKRKQIKNMPFVFMEKRNQHLSL